jgi:hypothetical protein
MLSKLYLHVSSEKGLITELFTIYFSSVNVNFCLFVYRYRYLVHPVTKENFFINAMRKSLSKNHIELRLIQLSASTLTFVNSATLLRNAS